MVNERIYFDIGTPPCSSSASNTPQQPSGKVVALLTHPVTIIKAMLRAITHRKK